MMGVLWKVLLTLLSAFLVRHTLKVISITGVFVHRHNHQPGPCRVIPGIEYGSEDIQVLPNGVAIISAGYRTLDAGAKASNDLRGFYMFDFNHPERNVTKLSIQGKLQIEDLAPHGLSLWKDPNTGIVTVFVINHGPTKVNNESVEVFRFDEVTKSLHHIKTIKDNHFLSMNDLVVTSNETFYVTNDCTWSHQNPLRWNIETCLQAPLGNVVFYDGQSARQVASGFVLPNGINVSPDHRFVYVILCGEAQMSVLRRQDDNSLTEIKRVDLYMARPDNLDVQPNGDLWIAGSYKLFYENQMSTMVLRGREVDGEFTFSEVYVNDGTEVSWASVATLYGNQLLIGTPEWTLLYCDVKAF